MKRCTKCGERKSNEEFYKDKSHRDGLMTRCKACHKAYQVAHREERRAYHQQRYRDNRDAYRRRHKVHYEANREKYAAQHRRYYQENRARMRTTQERYRRTKKGRETVRILREGHRARQLGIEGILSVGQWEFLSIAFKSCLYCGRTFGRGNRKRTLDHVVPLSRSGTHVLENILPACARCNASKGDRQLGEWVPPLLRR